MRLHGVPTVGLPVTESRRNFMNASRLTALVCGGVATAMLAACSTYPVGPTYSSTTTTAPVASAGALTSTSSVPGPGLPARFHPYSRTRLRLPRSTVAGTA